MPTFEDDMPEIMDASEGNSSEANINIPEETYEEKRPLRRVKKLDNKSLLPIIERKASRILSEIEIPYNGEEATGLLQQAQTGGNQYGLIRVSTGEYIEINGSVIIGKSDQLADYVVRDNNTISKRHAKFSVIGGVLVVQDLGSLNGTMVNGIKITPGVDIVLSPESRLTLSNEEFHVTR